MTIDHDAVQDAARLVAKGTFPKRRPQFDSDYKQLVERWKSDPAFRDVVRAVASGFDCYVVGDTVSIDSGIILGPGPESPFAHTLSSLRRNLNQSDAMALGIVMVGLAAVFYPNAESLDDSERTLRQTTLARARDILIQICERLESEIDDEHALASYQQGWRVLLSKSPFNDPKGDRAGADRARPGSVEGLIRMVANHWDDQGLLKIRQPPTGGTVYFALDRLRLMVAEYASHPLLELAQESARTGAPREASVTEGSAHETAETPEASA